MAASSVRVRHIVELVAELSDEERPELETELQDQEISVGRAWGAEIDRRAAQALGGPSAAVPRCQLSVLLEADPAEARARLAQMRPSPKG